ncbi:hypothetical protein VTI74DRAFT_8344 [Chaetomium olivicolor]
MITNQMDLRQHPLLATVAAIAADLQDEHRNPRASHMQSAKEGPVYIIAKVSPEGKCEDELYVTNNEGIPFPDPVHSKTLSGILPLERIVHFCGSGAFGYFECTKDVTGLTKTDFLSTVGEKTPVFGRFSNVTFGKYRNSANFLADFDALYDLLAHTPEANHTGLMFFNNHGYGCHTFKFCPDTAEAPYATSDNIVSHKSTSGTRARRTTTPRSLCCGQRP